MQKQGSLHSVKSIDNLKSSNNELNNNNEDWLAVSL
jgi:hypothetical protein